MEKGHFNEQLGAENNIDGRGDQATTDDPNSKLISRPNVPIWRITLSLILLFLNYFLAQYDKFILSYFKNNVIASLALSEAGYGIVSGYATGIVYALLALPTAYIADYTGARVWILTIAALWWSLCAIFQGLSHNFWQILLARIGMGIGQAPVESVSVSLISDLMGKEYVFFGERSGTFQSDASYFHSLT
jgi:MFS family permease